LGSSFGRKRACRTIRKKKAGGKKYMLNMSDIVETITMIQDENLDIRTITMGISLLDCCDSDIDRSCEKVYEKIYNRNTESPLLIKEFP